MGRVDCIVAGAGVAGLAVARALAQHGRDLKRLDAGEVRALEPEVTAVAGLYSPSTGIFDSHGLMLAYLGDAENAGTDFAIQDASVHGVRGLVNLFGIESPRLTSSLAIGEHVGKLAH
jgi:L-2-hydroxyglutarate oxidase LhgO